MIQQQSRTQQSADPPGWGENAGYYSQCAEFVESNPGLSVLIGLGLGFGAGIALASLLGGSTSREENLAERIGHRVADSVRDAIPSSWKKALRT